MKLKLLVLSTLVITQSAQALVYAPASTPENDLYDGATKLEWIKSSTLDAGLSAGYRLATAAEARDLLQKTTISTTYNSPWNGGAPYYGEPRSVFFDLGTNTKSGASSMIEAVSIGYVDGGANSVLTLAGMLSTVEVYGSPKASIQTTYRGGSTLVGTQADFLANKFDVKGTGVFPLLDWTANISASSYTAGGQFNVGYFMVKTNLNLSPIPEASTSVMMLVGLLGVAGLKRRSSR